MVDCGAAVVGVVVVLLLLEPSDEEAPDEPVEVLDVDVLCDPGRTTASATAPATPEMPTADVTAFIRARSRRRLRCGWSNIAG